MASVPRPALTPSRQIAVREDWLAQRLEEILLPDLPIVDPHHHLWDREGERYLLDDLLRDTASGHDIRATVFVQCGAMYRTDGPEALRPLGETEFVNGFGAAAASGRYGPTRACAGIVGFADLTLGDAVAPVLDAHLAAAETRFRGVRNRTAWHPSPEVRSNLLGPPPGPLEDPRFSEGARHLAARGLVLDVWAYQTQLPLVAAIARAFAAEPDLLVCDEITSALDASVQARLLDQLAAMQRRAGTAMLLITHDLSAVWRMAGRVVVMREGRILEHGETATVFRAPAHPYTAGLLIAATRATRFAEPILAAK